MVDCLAWAKADPLTVEQAARLWAEVDPSTPTYALTSTQSAAIAARLQMLAGKITVGTLKADTRANALAFIGRHETSLVLRSELKALAVTLNERPAFLFAEEAFKSSVLEPDGQTAPNSDQPATESPLATATFKSLFGGDATAPVTNPSPIRIVPGPRRFSMAPPPPATVRGGSVWFPQREPEKATIDQSLGVAVGTVDSAQAEQQRPVPASRESKEVAAVEPTLARRAGRPVKAGGNRAHLDGDLVREVLEAVETGRAKSYLAAATRIKERIGGDGTLESKIKRIAAKASAAARLKATS